MRKSVPSQKELKQFFEGVDDIVRQTFGPGHRFNILIVETDVSPSRLLTGGTLEVPETSLLLREALEQFKAEAAAKPGALAPVVH